MDGAELRVSWQEATTTHGIMEHRISCRICRKVVTQGAYKRHMRIHSGQFPHQCQYCSKGYINRSDLQGHMSQHTGIKEFRCSFCNAEFAFKNVLKKHMIIVHDFNAS